MTTAAVPQRSPEQSAELVSADRAWIVDVREPDEYRREHISGTVLCPTSTVPPQDFPVSRPGQEMLVLCRSGTRAGRVVDALRAAGRSDAAVIHGGITAWMGAGLPVQRNARVPLPIMRQSLMAAGALVLAFTALAWAHSAWWLLGTAFVGTGLTIAGTSGFCGMAWVLAKMPWNRSGR